MPKRTFGNGALTIEGTPWDQQVWESDSAFAKFLTYLNLGPTRSLVRAEAVSRGRPKVAQPSGIWGDLASECQWVRRCDAYDKAQGLKQREAIQTDREKAAVEQDRGIAKASELIAKFLAGEFVTEAEELVALRRLKQAIGIGKFGEFLLNGHKALFGEKHDVKVSEEWKTITFQSIRE